MNDDPAIAVVGTGEASQESELQVVALHSVLKDGHVDGYKRDHDRVPDELLTAFDAVGIKTWDIWRSGPHLFHLVTCTDFDSAMATLENEPANQRWQSFIGVHTDRFEGPDGREELRPSEVVWRMTEQQENPP
jgi:L-rhamnose mutarotase